MGTFKVSIEIGDSTAQRYERVDALVDTGGTYTTVPQDLLRRLGVVPHVRDAFILADERRFDRDIGRIWVRVDGRTDMQILLGAYTLEALRLAVDPVARKLIAVPGLLV